MTICICDIKANTPAFQQMYLSHKSCHLKIAHVNGALQSGDGPSTKKLVKDSDIVWASKGGNADLSKRSKDDFSTGLIPDDLDYKYFAAKPVALTVTGDGN